MPFVAVHFQRFKISIIQTFVIRAELEALGNPLMPDARLAVTFILAILPAQAADTTVADPDIRVQLLHRVNIFSDDPHQIHDPRHVQAQNGTDRIFAPIGLIATNNPVPDDKGSI
jgi:hypothetical protein